MALPAVMKRIEKKLDLILVALSKQGEKLDKLHTDFYEVSDDDEIESSSNADEEEEEEDDNKKVAAIVPEFLFPKEIKETSPHHVWKVRSHTNPSTKYTVSLSNEGWSCTCPAFTFRKIDGYVCKHIKEIKDTEF